MKTVNKKTIEKTIVKPETSKTSNHIEMVKKLTPEDQSPKVYYELVRQAMGTDKDGQLRPIEDIYNFMYTCKRTGLDPIVKQIYAVFRWNSRVGRETMTIQTGIDGMRLVAQRSGLYAGQDDIVFLPEEESSPFPTKASCTVYKMMGDQRVSFTASARWAEYVQKNKEGKYMDMWAKMPYLMLGKCAEALALRKAFPNELSGLYAEEEMHQSSNLLSELPTPDKFVKTEKKIEVLHGAPMDEQISQPPMPSIPGSASELPEKPVFNATGPIETVEVVPNLANMRMEIKNTGTGTMVSGGGGGNETK